METGDLAKPDAGVQGSQHQGAISVILDDLTTGKAIIDPAGHVDQAVNLFTGEHPGQRPALGNVPQELRGVGGAVLLDTPAVEDPEDLEQLTPAFLGKARVIKNGRKFPGRPRQVRTLPDQPVEGPQVAGLGSPT